MEDNGKTDQIVRRGWISSFSTVTNETGKRTDRSGDWREGEVKVMVMLEFMMIGILKQTTTTSSAGATPNERCMRRTIAMHARFQYWYTF